MFDAEKIGSRRRDVSFRKSRRNRFKSRSRFSAARQNRLRHPEDVSPNLRLGFEPYGVGSGHLRRKQGSPMLVPRGKAGDQQHRREAADLRRAQDEALLVRRVASGEARAFEELYRIYHPRLTRFLINILRRPHLVEEALDDTMMVVWRRPDAFTGASKVSTWIFAIGLSHGPQGAAVAAGRAAGGPRRRPAASRAWRRGPSRRSATARCKNCC